MNTNPLTLGEHTVDQRENSDCAVPRVDTRVNPPPVRAGASPDTSSGPTGPG
jgi:hypothetical protein